MSVIRKCVYCSGSQKQILKVVEDGKKKYDKDGKRVLKEVPCKECIEGYSISPDLIKALELLGIKGKK